MAPRYSPPLALLYDQEKRKGNANRATLAVARKLVAYLMAVDRGQRPFEVVEACPPMTPHTRSEACERPMTPQYDAPVLSHRFACMTFGTRMPRVRPWPA